MYRPHQSYLMMLGLTSDRAVTDRNDEVIFRAMEEVLLMTNDTELLEQWKLLGKLDARLSVRG